MLSRLTSLPRAWPFTFGVGISTVKTVAADCVAQKYVEGRDTLDRRRSAVFMAWGALYLGGVQYFIYVFAFQRIFPSAAAFVAKPVAERLADRAGQVTVLKQVALDQFVHHPFVLFPCFYCVKETIERGGAFGADTARAALRKYRANIAEDCRVCWQTWVPAFLFNFSVCPMWARIPFVAVVSFGFTTYFSFLRGRPQVEARGEPL